MVHIPEKHFLCFLTQMYCVCVVLFVPPVFQALRNIQMALNEKNGQFLLRLIKMCLVTKFVFKQIVYKCHLTQIGKFASIDSKISMLGNSDHSSFNCCQQLLCAVRMSWGRSVPVYSWCPHSRNRLEESGLSAALEIFFPLR